MAKRESRQKPRQSDAIRGENKREKGDRDTDRDSDPFAALAREWANDRDTLRRVREWAEQNRGDGDVPRTADWQRGYDFAAEFVFAILNGTERKGKP
jgi:hypothetical protein